jgi:hypothetical protein
VYFLASLLYFLAQLRHHHPLPTLQAMRIKLSPFKTNLLLFFSLIATNQLTNSLPIISIYLSIYPYTHLSTIVVRTQHLLKPAVSKLQTPLIFTHPSSTPKFFNPIIIIVIHYSTSHSHPHTSSLSSLSSSSSSPLTHLRSPL